MTLNLIGTGLNKESLSAEALKVIETSDEVYLENYTVDFPFDLKELESIINKKIIPINREEVENESLIQKAIEKEITLLVYGDSLSATTHIQLILACKKQNIPFKIFHNTSIIIGVAETGLQLYKFGKTTSLPNWKEHTNKPTSFTNYIKENLSIGAHTLILSDIGLELQDALSELEISFEKESMNIEKIVIASNIGTEKSKIFYENLENLKSIEISPPFCFIVPGKLDHLENEFLEAVNILKQ